MDPPVSGTYKEPPRQYHMLWDEQRKLRPRVTNFCTAMAVAAVPLAPALFSKIIIIHFVLLDPELQTEELQPILTAL